MQQREKRLLTFLLGALGTWGLVILFEGVLLAPFQARLAKRAEMEKKVANRQQELEELEAIERQLMFWTIDSLPPDQHNAQRVYSEWLVDLARLSGLRNIEPALSNRTTIPDAYVIIPVTLTAEATLSELATFLHHFERARVLQRIVRFDVKSPETEGNPLLEVTINAEGLSLPDARQRPRLFPRATLKTPLTREGTRVEVDSASAFPEDGPLRLRIGREFLQVTHRNGTNWDVERGIDGTTAAEHPAGLVVEMAPVKPADPQTVKTIADYERLLTAGPFVKPRPPIVYSPRLPELADTTHIKGRAFTTQAKVTGWNPADGAPQYRLDDFSPASMQIDSEGRISWNPGPATEPDVYPVGVVVTSQVNPDRELTTFFNVTLMDPNLPPRISLPTSIPIAWIGRVWSLPVQAQDPDQSGPLSFTLAGQPPAGLTIDSRTGILRWNVAETIEPGNVSLTVQVSDGGNPPQTATATATVKVEDDAAQFTYLVGCIRDGDRWTAWLYDRSSNRSQYVKVGDRFQVSDIAGQVTEIDLKSMQFSDADGVWKLQQEQPLRKAELVAAPATAEAVPPASTDAPIPASVAEEETSPADVPPSDPATPKEEP